MSPLLFCLEDGAYFKPIEYKIKGKLSAWKAYLLSIVGTIRLVTSVTYGMLMHYMMIYSWSVNLLKEVESWCRNFI